MTEISVGSWLASYTWPRDFSLWLCLHLKKDHHHDSVLCVFYVWLLEEMQTSFLSNSTHIYCPFPNPLESFGQSNLHSLSDLCITYMGVLLRFWLSCFAFRVFSFFLFSLLSFFMCIFTSFPVFLKHTFSFLQIKSAALEEAVLLCTHANCSVACFVYCLCRPDLPWCMPLILLDHVVDFPVG